MSTQKTKKLQTAEQEAKEIIRTKFFGRQDSEDYDAIYSWCMKVSDISEILKQRKSIYRSLISLQVMKITGMSTYSFKGARMSDAFDIPGEDRRIIFSSELRAIEDFLIFNDPGFEEVVITGVDKINALIKKKLLEETMETLVSSIPNK